MQSMIVLAAAVRDAPWWVLVFCLLELDALSQRQVTAVVDGADKERMIISIIK